MVVMTWWVNGGSGMVVTVWCCGGGGVVMMVWFMVVAALGGGWGGVDGWLESGVRDRHHGPPRHDGGDSCGGVVVGGLGQWCSDGGDGGDGSSCGRW